MKTSSSLSRRIWTSSLGNLCDFASFEEERSSNPNALEAAEEEGLVGEGCGLGCEAGTSWGWSLS